MRKKEEILILKASGQLVPFSEDKLKESLARSGAEMNVINRIVSSVQGKLVKGMSTRKIYRMAFNMLKQDAVHLAARYQLKKAVMELGPAGYAFEKFIGEVFVHQGYKVKTGQIVMGKCVSHEIDVVAENDSQVLMIECKYHNLPGTVCDVKVPLYIQARFKDVEFMWLKLPGYSKKIHQGWVVTNTRFSSDAVLYGNCVGLHLMGWDFPEKGCLKQLIDEFCIYPITCLTTLTVAEKQHLLDCKIVLCKEISENEGLLNILELGLNRKDNVMREIKLLSSLDKVALESKQNNALANYH